MPKKRPVDREAPAPRLILVRREIVEDLRSILPNQSKEAVMETLGISSNTWTKLKRGMPVREGTGKTVIMRWESIRARGRWRENGPEPHLNTDRTVYERICSRELFASSTMQGTGAANIMELKGKRIAVTGGPQGISESSVRAYVEAGAAVYSLDVNQELGMLAARQPTSLAPTCWISSPAT